MGAVAKVRAAGEWAVIVLFLAALATPGALLLAGRTEFDPELENRNRAPLPAAPETLDEILAWPDAYEAWFEDSYGLRSELIEAHNRAQLALFGHSKNERVFVGEDGWLFFGDRRTDAYARAETPLTLEQLETYRLELEGHRDWLAERGIAFVMVLAPIKHSVYPEFLPATLSHGERPTRREQLLEHLRAHSDVQVVDLLPALLAAKPAGRLYHKTDTHWNMRGAYVAYRELLARCVDVLPGLAPWPEEDVVWRTETTPGMDLALLLRLPADLPEEQVVLDLPGAPAWRRVTTGLCEDCGLPPRGMFATESDDRDGPRAVVFGDSFFNNLRPLLAPHFSRLVGIPSHRIHHGVIEHERPDVVILEVVERQLMYPKRLLVKPADD